MPDNFSSLEFDVRFTRTVDYFGPEAFAKFRAATVAVMGLGGVGSHAAALLARNGIGTLHLVDFDTVTASSLNRSALATASDVGRLKVDMAKDALTRAVPDLAVATHAEFFAPETSETLLSPDLSFVVDAIDSVGPKVELIAACAKRNIPVISCLGAAARIRGELVHVTNLFDSHTCPLARIIRKRLHQAGIRHAIPAVFSTETPKNPLPADPSEPHLRRGRPRRRLPSAGMVPGIAGYAAAGYVLRALAGVDIELIPPLPG